MYGIDQANLIKRGAHIVIKLRKAASGRGWSASSKLAGIWEQPSEHSACDCREKQVIQSIIEHPNRRINIAFSSSISSCFFLLALLLLLGVPSFTLLIDCELLFNDDWMGESNFFFSNYLPPPWIDYAPSLLINRVGLSVVEGWRQDVGDWDLGEDKKSKLWDQISNSCKKRGGRKNACRQYCNVNMIGICILIVKIITFDVGSWKVPHLTPF